MSCMMVSGFLVKNFMIKIKSFMEESFLSLKVIFLFKVSSQFTPKTDDDVHTCCHFSLRPKNIIYEQSQNGLQNLTHTNLYTAIESNTVYSVAIEGKILVIDSEHISLLHIKTREQDIISHMKRMQKMFCLLQPRIVLSK